MANTSNSSSISPILQGVTFSTQVQTLKSWVTFWMAYGANFLNSCIE